MKTIFGTALLLCGSGLLVLAEPGAPRAAKVDFSRDIQPIISEKCYHCHGQDDKARKAKLRLDIRDEAISDRDGIKAIVPGKPEESELIARILTKDEEEVMPPPKEGHPVTAHEVERFKQWIADGAPYAAHWAFQNPKMPAVPALPANFQARNPIDHFIAVKLAEQQLPQSPEADKTTLLRRVSLDLTGLPPTLEEVTAFTADTSAEAYEKAIDRMTASPHFGERWARMWLDLARYADSTGYGSDKMRLNIWPYRDWVINAFNRNLPFDQFTIEQLAGDLLPNATPEQIAATAFHRNTMTNVEGGTDDEEYRVAAIKDRVATTGQVWMGLTIGCAQCHTHKFDPITQKEYYQTYAIFNQSEDADREDEAPRLPVPTAHEKDKRARLSAEIKALEDKARTSDEFKSEQHSLEAAAHTPTDWKLLKVTEVRGRNEAFSVQDNGVIGAQGLLAPGEKYVVKAKSPVEKITAVRLEVLPDLTSGQVGLHEGNAVLTEFQLSVVLPPEIASTGRFVRVEHAPKRDLHLAEMQVFSGGENIAPKGKATQSSIAHEGKAELAIDGNTSGDFAHKSVTHLAKDDPNPWWEVDLGESKTIDKLIVWNRTDNDCAKRQLGATVSILNAERKVVFQRPIELIPISHVEFDPKSGINIPFVRASADFSQDNHSIACAIDNDRVSGWAFSPELKSAHAAVFETKVPAEIPENTEIAVTLRQDREQYLNLARFRLTATDRPNPVPELSSLAKEGLAREPTERSPEQKRAVEEAFLPYSKSFAAVSLQITQKKAELAAVRPVELPIMRERPVKERRKSFVLTKGNFMMPGEEVNSALLESFHKLPDAAEVNRLTLAKWIMDPQNPLTARVAVNRFWAQIFGAGIVETEEDFGTQGSLPTHPELLDWLALNFQSAKGSSPGALGYDVKALLKLLVTSQTYRQSSRVVAEVNQKDPRNRYLSHYARRRLDAEGVRDQALQLSGLLSQKIGGPSVNPPQPDGLWKVAFNGGQNGYKVSTGEDRYRRGIYTIWRRTMPNPTMSTFDAPSRETCTIRRIPTNTPLQAFVTLNDPVFVECAQAFARRIMEKGPAEVEARLRWAMQLCVGRAPLDAEVVALKQLFETELANYKTKPEDAKKLATEPLGPIPANTDPAELAAWTIISNVLLNLDSVLTRS